MCWVRAHTLNTYLRKLESWDQYGGMYVCMCMFGGKEGKCMEGWYV